MKPIASQNDQHVLHHPPRRVLALLLWQYTLPLPNLSMIEGRTDCGNQAETLAAVTTPLVGCGRVLSQRPQKAHLCSTLQQSINDFPSQRFVRIVPTFSRSITSASQASGTGVRIQHRRTNDSSTDRSTSISCHFPNSSCFVISAYNLPSPSYAGKRTL
jgi:hypothetical protein